MNNNTDVALSVRDLDKSFKLAHEKKNSLKEHIFSFKKQSFEEFQVLKNISFEVKRGEFFGVVGRNGSGKSTMLKVIGGIYQPTRGEVRVSGTLTPFIELGIGFNPELTGRENVYLNGAILGLTRKEIREKYDEVVEFAELEKFMDQKLKNYSSGMQVRLAFSIAIQAHNDVLLIDEVLAVGDAAFQQKCFRTFKSMKTDKSKTVIFVSHDMGAIRDFCDRAILIEGGKIVSEGAPDKVANDYIQLFNKDANQQLEGQENRWGDQKATISDITCKVGRKVINISYEIEGHATVDDPICGLIIKDLENHHILDSNTKWKGLKTGKISSGQKVRVNWEIPNVFRNGRYFITAAIAHADGYGFYDWQESAVAFDVSRPETTAGLLVLDDKITIN